MRGLATAVGRQLAAVNGHSTRLSATLRNVGGFRPWGSSRQQAGSRQRLQASALHSASRAVVPRRVNLSGHSLATDYYPLFAPKAKPPCARMSGRAAEILEITLDYLCLWPPL